MNPRKLLHRLLVSPRNVRFDDFTALARAFGFELDRVRGSYHIFKHGGIPELINV